MTEGWICPVCHAGVAPTVERCPCTHASAAPKHVTIYGPAHALNVCEHCGSSAFGPHFPGCPHRWHLPPVSYKPGDSWSATPAFHVGSDGMWRGYGTTTTGGEPPSL